MPPKRIKSPTLPSATSAVVPLVPRSGQVRIGISGWRYSPWRGVFYPPGLPQRKELSFAAQHFRSVEINGTFYSLQRPSSFRLWHDQTPADFVFALKGSRFLTHMKKLRNVEVPLANFFASGLLALGPKLGPILWQFPPSLVFDPGRFADFFPLLPRTLSAASILARRCDDRMLSRSLLELAPEADPSQLLHHCIEVRHESFVTPALIDLLRTHRIGLVVADTVEWPLLLDVTSSIVYIRLHGSEQLYASGYEPASIDLWADRIVAFAAGYTPRPAQDRARLADPAQLAPAQPRDVFVFFDNDVKVRAPFDALALEQAVRTRLT